MIEGHDEQSLQEMAAVPSASCRQQNTYETIPEGEISSRHAPKEEKGGAVEGQEAAFCQRIAQGDMGVAETAFPFQEQEAQDRNLMAQGQGMAAGGTKTVSGYKRQFLANPVFHGAIVSAHEEAERDAA